MINERRIGKVISVDSFRAYIKLDDDLKSLYKSGYEDIYEVARINSYIIIPIGAERIVALVTRVRSIDETEIKSDKDAIFLTNSARYLVATMIGTINTDGKYLQGVYNYPILDNPVWYVTKQDLDYIFDQKKKESIDFEKDYFLPIGTSPSFPDYQIKINPDKFFGKHAAILGNTGSGKSCTFSSIVQSLFAFDYSGKKLRNAHIIIFDTNGEYKNAFQGTQEKPYRDLELVNPFHIDNDGMKVPFWFMNYADFDYLFKPSELTQAPIFKTAIGYAKSKVSTEGEIGISKHFERFIISIIETDDLFVKKYHKPGGSWVINPNNDIIALAKEIPDHLPDIKSQLDLLGKEPNKINEIKIKQELEAHFLDYLNQKEKAKKTISESIDHPIFFDFSDLITTSIKQAIDESEGSSQKIREHLSTLKMRLHSYLSDERLSKPLLLGSKHDIVNGLAKYLSFIIGDFCKIYQSKYNDVFTNYFKQQLARENIEKLDDKKVSQVTIIDLSLLPFEVLETVTGLLGRLILDFVSRFQDKDRASLPIVLALEEAQNYIPEKNNGDKESISKRVFERIAREGRKYGLSLLVSSQRPSELSKTVLSQCNSFIIHRLQNPEDQKYVRQLVSAANEDILQQLPVLPQQHAVIMGDAVRSPVQARINNADPTPNSNDPKFITNWLADFPEDFPDYLGIATAWERGEKYQKIENGISIKDEPLIEEPGIEIPMNEQFTKCSPSAEQSIDESTEVDSLPF
jgi:DNA helicase HerA-like ATPase